MTLGRVLIPLSLLALYGDDRRSAPDALYQAAEWHHRHGRLQTALEHVERGLRQSDPDWRWRFRILKAEILLDCSPSQTALNLLQTQKGSAPASQETLARLHAARGGALISKPLEAQQELQTAHELAAARGAQDLMAAIEIRLGVTAADPVESDARLNGALSRAEKLGDRYLMASALNNLGYKRMASAHFDEAIPWFEKAREVARAENAKRVLQLSLGNLGWCLWNLADYDRALDFLLQAHSIAAEIGNKRGERTWAGNIGNVYYRKGRFQEAIGYYTKAAELSRSLGDDSGATGWLINVARVYLDLDDIPSAERHNGEAQQVQRQTNSKGLEPYLLLNSASIAVKKKQFEPAESIYRSVLQHPQSEKQMDPLWLAHAGLGSLYRIRNRPREAEEEYRQAVSATERAWARIQQDKFKVTMFERLIHIYQDFADLLVEQGRNAEALAITELSRARVLGGKLRAGSLATGFQVRELCSAARNTKAVLLSLWLAPVRSFVFVVDSQQVSVFALPSEGEINRLVEEHTRSIANGRDPLEQDSPAPRKLYGALLGEARRLIPSGSKVIIAPHGRLHGLNFETLVAGEPRPHYWIDDVTVAVAPSLAVVRMPETKHDRQKLLFFGDPTPPNDPSLPHLKGEADIVKRHFPESAQVIRSGAEAHPEAYRVSNPSQFSIIHFAAHAIANAENPLESAIILSPTPRTERRKLYARDVLDQKLRAELVTLSACRSAGAKAYAGEGLMGFSWAFLQAGARNVIAGLWDVDDKATAKLMDYLYEQMAAGRAPPEALREAKLKLMQSSAINRRPYYWAPFQVYTRHAWPARALAPKLVSRNGSQLHNLLRMRDES